MHIGRCLSLLLALVAASALAGQRARADDAMLEARLGGAAVVPPVATEGSGFIRLVFNTDRYEVSWFIIYEGLSGPVTAVRLHGPAGADALGPELLTVFGPLESPIIGGGTLSPDMVAAALADLLYVVVCTNAFPDGELRAQMRLIEVQGGGGAE